MTTRIGGARTRHQQSGVMLLEALLGILIFSIGILAMVGLQAVAMRNAAEAKYRSDASYHASTIISQIWSDLPAIDNYGHMQGGNTACQPSGTAASGGTPTDLWLDRVKAGLPGAEKNLQQVQISTPPAVAGSVVVSRRVVSVTVCWRSPQDNQLHNYKVVANVNG